MFDQLRNNLRVGRINRLVTVFRKFCLLARGVLGVGSQWVWILISRYVGLLVVEQILFYSGQELEYVRTYFSLRFFSVVQQIVFQRDNFNPLVE
jgi:hypothetical protein